MNFAPDRSLTVAKARFSNEYGATGIGNAGWSLTRGKYIENMHRHWKIDHKQRVVAHEGVAHQGFYCTLEFHFFWLHFQAYCAFIQLCVIQSLSGHLLNFFLEEFINVSYLISAFLPRQLEDSWQKVVSNFACFVCSTICEGSVHHIHSEICEFHSLATSHSGTTVQDVAKTRNSQV